MNYTFNPFSDPGGQKGAKITRTGKNFENRPIVRFLVTIGDYKSTEKRELPQYPRRAWLMCQTKKRASHYRRTRRSNQHQPTT